MKTESLFQEVWLWRDKEKESKLRRGRVGGCGLEFLSLEHLDYVLGQPSVP